MCDVAGGRVGGGGAHTRERLHLWDEWNETEWARERVDNKEMGSVFDLCSSPRWRLPCLVCFVTEVINTYQWANINMNPCVDLIGFAPKIFDNNGTLININFGSWTWPPSLPIDGLCLYPVKHVQISYWPDFNAAAGVHNKREILDGDPAYTCLFQDCLDVLNCPFSYSLTVAFRDCSRFMVALVSTISSVDSGCKDPTLQGKCVETHDNSCIPSLNSNRSLGKNVIAITILEFVITITVLANEMVLIASSCRSFVLGHNSWSLEWALYIVGRTWIWGIFWTVHSSLDEKGNKDGLGKISVAVLLRRS